MEICHQILEKIKAYDTIIIHRHMKPDPDALGSQVGLKALLEHHFPEKTIKAVGFNEPTLSWLAEMDEVDDQEFEGSLAIICDTANTARIDDKRYTQADTIIKIDHHPNDEVYGDLVWVDTNSSSASEMIALFAEATNLVLSDYAAKMLCAEHGHTPHYVPMEDPLVQTLLNVYEKQTGLQGHEQVIGGGTFGRLLERGVAYGAMFPDSIDTMHQANEFIALDDLFRAAAIYAEAIYELIK